VFGHPLALHVVLDDCSYAELMSTGCVIYFRTVDEEHKPLADVHFSPQLNLEAPAHSDFYGRWQGLINGAYDVTFDKTGFAPATARIECKNGVEIDQEVVMRRSTS
jgi:hypothetical protein